MDDPSANITLSAEIQRVMEAHASWIEAATKRVLGPSFGQHLDDIREEVRIAIWQVLNRRETINHWTGFIYDCAHKRALDRLKQLRRRSRIEVALNDLSSEPLGHLRADEYETTRERLSLVKKALSELPESIRLVIILRKAEGYSRREVADMLRCSQATVDYRLRIGLRRLRKALRALLR